MKKLLLLTFAFCLYTFSFSQECGWVDISNNIPINSDNYGFQDVFFINDNEGWIAPFGYYNEGGKIEGIYHTKDGGLTFDFIQTDGVVNTIHFLDSLTGFIGMQEARVYKTTDGGKNWTILFPLTGTPVRDIDFFQGSDTGYCCGDIATVHQITLEGLFKIENDFAANLKAVSVYNNNEAITCGEGTALKIKNKNVIIDQGAPLTSSSDLFCFANGKGFMVGSDGWNNSIGVIKKTEDSKIWKTNYTFNEDRTVLMSVHFINENEGWAAGYDGILLHTSNCGESWEVDKSFSTEKYEYLWEQIFFTSATNGIVVGARSGNGIKGKILKYTQITATSNKQIKQKTDLELFPNPVHDKFKVQCSMFNVENTTIELYDLTGKKLLEKQISAETNNAEIDVSHLKNGVYFCRLFSEKFSTTQKLIIQK